MLLRPVANPPNPYLSEHRELLEPAPLAAFEVYEEHAKSILAENDSPDIPFRWSVNPYRGCQHACAYCYARTTHEYLNMGAGTDFDTRLVAKVNAPELLAAAFSKRAWSRDSVCFSGVTDCYQPIEATYQLTRRCLEVCVDYANPVSIITKSCLVVRDADLLRRLDESVRTGMLPGALPLGATPADGEPSNAMPKRSAGMPVAHKQVGNPDKPGVRIFISIPFADDAMGKLIEPQAATITRRFDAVRRLREAGLSVGVMVAPIIPGLNDREIPAVLRRAADAGACSAAYIALRLPRNVAPVFLSRLHEALPLRADRVEARIREMRGGKLNDTRFGNRMRGDGPYWENIRSLFEVSAARYGLEKVKRGADASPTGADDYDMDRANPSAARSGCGRGCGSPAHSKKFKQSLPLVQAPAAGTRRRDAGQMTFNFDGST